MASPGGQAALAFLVLAALAFGGGAPTHGALLLTLASVTLGFLAYNLRLPGRARALVFMGDAGSMFLGFGTGLVRRRPEPGPRSGHGPGDSPLDAGDPAHGHGLHPASAALPAGARPSCADREHLHHLLQTLGLGVERRLSP